VKAPAFQFYPSDFLMGTMMMSAEEVGAYIRLLCYQWDKGSVPNDDAALARIGGCGGNTIVSIRYKFGIGPDGNLRNGRLELVRDKQDAYRKQQTENIEKRWKGHKKDTTVLPTHIPNGYSPSPTPSPTSSVSSENTLAAGKPLRARNETSDALAWACQIDPFQMTARAAQSCAVAAASIKKVLPNVDRAEMDRRAANYCLRFPNASLTPRALGDHWAECDTSPKPRDITVSWQRPETTDEQHAKGF
jgi:uncharacterized protein YdaU (DUF1376 family)